MKMSLPLVVLTVCTWTAGAHAQDVLFTLKGQSGERLYRTANAGDVNADGVNDLLIGGYQFGNGGAAKVYSGADQTLLHQYQGTKGSGYGWEVAGVGDVNNDGFADFAVTSVFLGQATVYSGQDGSVLHLFDEGGSNTMFGLAVAGAGDVNRDGHDDIAVGSAGDGNWAGYVKVYSGKNGVMFYKMKGDDLDFLGYSIAGIADQDNDGVEDLLIGAPNANYWTGEAYIVSAATGQTLQILTSWDSGPLGFGNDVSRGGDVDNDGVDDLLVSNSSYPQRAYVYSGVDRSLLWTFDIGRLGDTHYTTVCDAGDVNGDGHADVMLALAGHSCGWPGPTTAVMYSGKSGDKLYEYVGNSVSGVYTTITSLGDIDGDGLSEIAIGEPAGSKGKVRVRSGNDLYLVPTNTTPSGGQKISLDFAGGPKKAVALLYVTDVDGVSLDYCLAAGKLSRKGFWSISDKVPMGLSGMSFTLQGFAVESGELLDSGTVKIQVQ